MTCGELVPLGESLERLEKSNLRALTALTQLCGCVGFRLAAAAEVERTENGSLDRPSGSAVYTANHLDSQRLIKKACYTIDIALTVLK